MARPYLLLFVAIRAPFRFLLSFLSIKSGCAKEPAAAAATSRFGRDLAKGANQLLHRRIRPATCVRAKNENQRREGAFLLLLFFCSKSLLFLSSSFQRMTRANTVSTSPSGASSQKIENGRGGRDDCDLIRERMVVQ